MKRVLIHMGDPYLVDNPCTKRVRAFREGLEEQGVEAIRPMFNRFRERAWERLYLNWMSYADLRHRVPEEQKKA